MKFTTEGLECALCGGAATKMLLRPSIADCVHSALDGSSYAGNRYCTWCAEAVLNRPLTTEDFRVPAYNLYAPALWDSLSAGSRLELPSHDMRIVLEQLSSTGGEGLCPIAGGPGVPASTVLLRVRSVGVRQVRSGWFTLSLEAHPACVELSHIRCELAYTCARAFWC